MPLPRFEKLPDARYAPELVREQLVQVFSKHRKIAVSCIPVSKPVRGSECFRVEACKSPRAPRKSRHRTMHERGQRRPPSLAFSLAAIQIFLIASKHLIGPVA